IVKKMIFAYSIFDIINNLSRFHLISIHILLQLLKMEYPAVPAATIATIIASFFSYLAINLIVRKIQVFGSKKKIF
ncbi:MAG: hypothetical protein WB474_13845, partial [Nitrososphaeraceae archaeon]